MEWIHVRTDTKEPEKRTGGSPFEHYPEGVNPNASPAFGAGSPTMFLTVTRNSAPTVNPVTSRISEWRTMGVDGRYYLGRYEDPGWVVGYDVLEQDLILSRNIKTAALDADWTAYTDAGYPVGQFRFPLTETFFQLLTTRRAWLDAAVADGTVPPDRKITFSDLDGKEVSRDLDTLNNQYPGYGNAYVGAYEVVVRAQDEIEAAADVNAVDAVTWTFP